MNMTPTPPASCSDALSDERIHAAIRNAGGIVHSDGNIFFTNAAKFLAAAASLSPASCAGSGWKPIETAPKDGTLFLGWVASGKFGEDDEGRPYETDNSCVDFCEWIRESPEGHPGYFSACAGPWGDWQDITHWMPLPAAPSLSAPPPADVKENERG
jgi:hypothetical protein